MTNVNITDFGPDAGGRVKVRNIINYLLRTVDCTNIFPIQGLTVVKPIVYGNVARSFGKKREEDGHTHQWNVYIKPFNNEDMSAYVKKVHFKLHESYANPNRILTKPPYEVTETGWGEFEVVIKLYFHDPTERPVTLYHILKLFQSPVVDADGVVNPAVSVPHMDSKKGLVSESYEEMVFQEPTQLMQHCLNGVQPLTQGVYLHDTDCEYLLKRIAFYIKHIMLDFALLTKVK